MGGSDRWPVPTWPLKEGDRVTYCYFYPCDRCPACLDGHRAACPNKRRGTRYADDPPHFVGSYGEYFYLRPGHFVYKVPDSISDDVATPVNCALAQVLYGLDRVRVRVGDTVSKGHLLARGITRVYFQANVWIFTGLVLAVSCGCTWSSAA